MTRLVYGRQVRERRAEAAVDDQEARELLRMNAAELDVWIDREITDPGTRKVCRTLAKALKGRGR